MPKLGQYSWILDLTFFLYPSAEAAKNGSMFGGTGFFVTLEYERSSKRHVFLYAVTTAHVALGDKRSGVVRINKTNGQTEILETREDDWFSIPGRYDIAVLPMNCLNQKIHKVEAINISPDDPSSFFLSEKQTREYDINAGEDVFMAGRFVNYAGAETNRPSLRFGNISIMAADIRHPLGYTGKSIVLDMRSQSGYSGSPVFVYRTAGSLFLGNDSIGVRGHMLKLLGIHWYQFPENSTRNSKFEEVPSGMTAIHPANYIIEVLNTPELTAKREEVMAR